VTTHGGTARTAAEMAAKVRELMEGHSQRELAQVLGVDASAISRALAGKRTLNLTEVVRVADYLGVEPECILFQDEPVFALRADADDEKVRAAESQCTQIIRDFSAFRTVAK